MSLDSDKRVLKTIRLHFDFKSKCGQKCVIKHFRKIVKHRIGGGGFNDAWVS